ncbi:MULTISPECIES: phosphatidate cytidylyltransferase [Comamonas]|uniref:phosphatidate cytidylyltransferase n=1 Tax=Comamonas TaxID=283 RepID=UPI00257BB5C2|nr:MULTISPECIES: phosphatidate cytidylyltransferase [Comamonas]
MLLQRVITAVVLLAILLPALFASNPLAFNMIVLVMLTAGAWEWGRLIGLRAVGAVVTGVVMLLLCLLTWQQGWLSNSYRVLWVVAGGAWVLLSVLLVKAGVPAWGRVPQWMRWLAGMLALWVAGLAIVQARQIGINFLLSVLALVWVADVFAYFFGRALGLRFTKQKLAPTISPGKSWEGAWGGALGVVLMAFAWVWIDAAQKVEVASFYTHLYEQGWWLLLVAALFMAAMSVLGDLVESLIKRSAGFKDSSQLLPGHGGVLDRIDALLPTLPLAMMLTSLVQ